MNKHMFDLPERTVKPRTSGLTMVIDSFMGTRGTEDLIETASEWVDYVKFGWGTALVNPIVKKKIKMLRDHDIEVCLGGTFYEVAHVNGKLAEYEEFLNENDIKLMEISDGTIDLPRDTKLEHIAHFAKNFKVLSEYGSKDSQAEIKAPRIWAEHMREELDAGAWKAIAEGRESGTAGMYRQSSELRTGLVDEITETISTDDILWEAPKKQHQTWFIQKYGSNVNLGNINPKDVIPLETLRLGLRSDTLLNFHGN